MATTPSYPKVLHRSRFGKKRGFTLLELVVALVVLGILAALAIPTYLTVIDNAKVGVANSVALSVTDDAIAIAAEAGTYPGPLPGDPTAYAIAVSETHGATLLPGYPSDPPGTVTACYDIVTSSVNEDVCTAAAEVVNAGATVISDTAHDSTTTTTSTTTSTTTTTVADDTPSAPTDVVVTPGDSSITVTWSPPDSDGGSPVTGYTVSYSSDGGTTWSSPTSATSPDTVTGLSNGTTYTVQVVAVNAHGSGTESSHLSGTPAAVTDITTAANESIAITPNGAYAYATNSGNVYKVDLATNTVVASMATGLPSGGDGPIIVNHDGTRAYIAGTGGYAIGNEIGVVDLTTFTMDPAITVGPDGADPAGLAINNAGTRLYVLNNHNVGEQGSIGVVDLTDDTVVATVTDSSCNDRGFNYFAGIGIDPASNYLYLESGAGSICGVVDLSTNTLTTPGSYSGSDTTAYVALRGFTESAGPAGIVEVDENTGGYQTPLSLTPTMGDVVISSDGTYAYGTILNGNSYYEIDLATSTATELGSVTGGANMLDVTPSGSKIYVMKQSGGIKVIPVP
jgi:prepilin-type N-terminal cleavage/methylation domain-containing protein